MTRSQISRLVSIASGLLTVSLLVPTVVHATPTDSASGVTEAKRVEETVILASTSGEPLTQSATRSSSSVSLDDDGIATLVTNDPDDFASIDIDNEVSAGLSLADASVVDGDLVQSAHPSVDTAYPLVTTAKIGVFQTKGDYVHVTRGQASGHGWWLKGTTKATKAKVTVQLQYKPKKNSSWHNRGKAGVKTIKPGTSKRANARMTCRSSGNKQWRSWIDVDLIGYLDTPNKLYTPARTIKCTL